MLSTPFRTGLALTASAAIIAAGPMMTQALGLGEAESAPTYSASWESDQVRNADNASSSHTAVVKAEQARQEAERKAKAKAKAKAEAARKAAERRAVEAQTSRSASRGGTPAKNRALGMQMCADEGWSASQCADLGKLWQKESGWNHKAANSSSGAYGIPQALPGSKMGTVASDWRTNPATQIEWGLNYIKGRYGSPSRAWAHSQSHGWY